MVIIMTAFSRGNNRTVIHKTLHCKLHSNNIIIQIESADAEKNINGCE